MHTVIVNQAIQVIREALSYRYKRHIPHSLICQTKTVTGNTPEISFLDGSAQLLFRKNSDEETQVYAYQLPQTRIKCQVIQSVNRDFYILEYFGQSIILCQPAPVYDGKKDSIILKTDLQMLHSGTEIKTTGTFEFLKDDSYIVLVNPASGFNPEAAPELLKEWIRLERQWHPLNQFSINNADHLVQIDRLWSLLPFIGPTGKITEKSAFGQPGILILLQEIYMQLGWFDQLDDLYGWLKKNAADSCVTPLLVLAYTRYQSVSQIFGRMPVSVSLETDRLRQAKFRFLDQVVTGFYENNPDERQKIQQFWELIHLPAVDTYFRNSAAKYPEEMISFALLALNNNFSWFHILKKKLVESLPEAYQTIFRFLCLINENGSVGFDKDHLIWSRHNGNRDAYTSLRESRLIEANFHSFGKTDFTELKHTDGIHFKIDREAILKYNLLTDTIEVQPKLFRPPFINPEFNWFGIKISNRTLKLPVLWDQFVIHFEGVRFKFLRKKKKIQLSIKFTAQRQEVLINGILYKKSENKYLKILLGLPVDKYQFFSSIQNEFGSEQGSAITRSTGLRLRLYGLNKFGILQPVFRIRKEAEKKSYLNDALSPELPAIPITANSETLTCHSIRMDPVRIELIRGDTIIKKLLYSAPSELIHLIIIYLDQAAADVFSSNLRQVLLECFGFSPVIDYLENYQYSATVVPVIIGINIARGQQFEIRFLSEKPIQQAIYLQREFVNQILEIMLLRKPDS